MFDDSQNNTNAVTPDPSSGGEPVVSPEPTSVTPPVVLNEMGVPTDQQQSTPMPDPIVPPLSPPVTPPPAPEFQASIPLTTPVLETPAPLTPPEPVSAPEVVATSETPSTNNPLPPDMPLAFNSNAPLPTTTPEPETDASVVEEDVAKKPKKGLIMGMVAALVLMVTAGATYYTYTQYAGEQARIAEITDKKLCNGCSPDGFEWKWHSATNKCSKSAQKCDRNPAGSYVPNVNYDDLDESQCASNGNGIWCNSVDSNGKAYKFCIDDRKTEGCNAAAVRKGYTIVYGSTGKAGKCDSETNPGAQTCDCGGYPFCFDKTGVCNSASVPKDWANPDTNDATQTYYNKYGLCAGVGSYSNGVFTPKKDSTACYTCTDAGCTAVDGVGCTAAANKCVVRKYTCPAGHSGTCLLNPEDPKNGYSFTGKCGTIEQIDVTCGGVLASTRSRTNGSCSPTPSASIPSSPSLSCKSLTKNVADSAIVVGSPVVFTCLGATVPAGATALSYQFRSKTGAGSYSTMTNVTATTASLTPTQCGVTYTVECRACGTIANATVCSQTWTGVTP